MNRRPKTKNNTMKLRKLLASLTVAALAALTLATVSAAEPLLSPRAKANEIVRIAGTEADHIDRGLPTASPKELAIRASLARVSGSEADHLDRDVSSVSPRLAATFPEVAAHARALQSGGVDAMAACKTMKAGTCKLDCAKTKGACAMPCCKS